MKWISKSKYILIHQWLKNKFGRPKKCDHCNDTKKGYYEYALIKGLQYEKKRDNFLALCKPCHFIYDGVDTKILHTYRNEECMNRINKAKLKSINQYKNGTLINSYESLTEASAKTGVGLTSISNNLTNRSKSAGGYLWKING
jgi:hypothetical protein